MGEMRAFKNKYIFFNALVQAGDFSVQPEAAVSV